MLVIVFSDSKEQSKQYRAGKYPLIFTERQAGQVVTAGPTNVVWWQAHEITSGFGQSHNPSRKTGGKY